MYNNHDESFCFQTETESSDDPSSFNGSARSSIIELCDDQNKVLKRVNSTLMAKVRRESSPNRELRRTRSERRLSSMQRRPSSTRRRRPSSTRRRPSSTRHSQTPKKSTKDERREAYEQSQKEARLARRRNRKEGTTITVRLNKHTSETKKKVAPRAAQESQSDIMETEDTTISISFPKQSTENTKNAQRKKPRKSAITKSPRKKEKEEKLIPIKGFVLKKVLHYYLKTYRGKEEQVITNLLTKLKNYLYVAGGFGAPLGAYVCYMPRRFIHNDLRTGGYLIESFPESTKVRIWNPDTLKTRIIERSSNFMFLNTKVQRLTRNECTLVIQSL